MLLTCFGIDPGTTRCGWSYVTLTDGTPKIIEAGVSVQRQRDDLATRISAIRFELEVLCKMHGPFDLIAIEKPFVQHRTAAIALGAAWGVAASLSEHSRNGVMDLAPREAKKIVAGHGGASKADVKTAASLLAGTIPAGLPHDASDAVAIAVAGLLKLQGRSVLGALTG